MSRTITVTALAIYALTEVRMEAQQGSLDLTFPQADGAIWTVATDSAGRLVISGFFTSVGGVTRNGVARLNSNGAIDNTFDPGAGVDYRLRLKAAVQSDDQVVLGGQFTSVGGISRTNMARLLVNGSVDPGFVQHNSAGQPVMQRVDDLIIDDRSRILATGDAGPVGYTARFNTNGLLDTTYNSTTEPFVRSWRQSDGKRVIIDATGMKLKRLNTDGSTDTNFISLLVGGSGTNIVGVAVQPNDKLVVVTTSLNLLSGYRSSIFRLTSNGDRDAGFPAAVSSEVYSVAVLPTGRIVIGGFFGSVNGVPRGNLAALIGDDPGSPPQIASDPKDQAAPFGGTASFSVAVSGGEIPSYQWRFNGQDMPGETNATLRLTNLRLDQTGNYSVLVRNTHGSAQSNSARLDVWPANCPGPSFGILLPVNPGPVPPVAADFNGDGKADLAMFDSNRSNVLVRLGVGDGSFQPPVALHVGGVGTLLAAADLNGDARLDLIVVTGFFDSGGVAVLIGRGDGTFESPVQTISESVDWGPASAVVSDFNGDGKLDLALAHYLQGSPLGVAVYLGRGDGTLAPGVRYSTGAPFAALSHFGSWLGPIGRCTVTAGDVNRDGKIDLIFTNPGAGLVPQLTTGVQGSISALLGNGDGSFGPPLERDMPAYPYAAALEDFDKDGRADLVVVGYDAPTWSPPAPISGAFVLRGNGNGTFQDPVNYSVGQNPVAVTTGDFNSDHQRDIVIATYSGVSLLLGNGNGTFQPSVNVGLPSDQVGVADFNGDGLPDIFEASAVMLNTCTPPETAPRLSCVVSNSTINISWATLWTTVILESAPTPASTNWQTVVELPTAVNGTFRVTIPINQSESYFRLREL